MKASRVATREPAAGRDAKHPELKRAELVIITGLSGSGKGTVLKAFEDLGYYAVDNLPIGLIPKFAELTREAANVRRAALVIDIREGHTLKQFPAIFKKLRSRISATLLFLEADDRTIVRRFSETRRPHPLGVDASVLKSIRDEREQLAPIRAVADHIINTSKFNVHELREVIGDKFQGGREEAKIRIDITSFGYRHGVPQDSDLVFDVRFLPNPNYIPAFKNLTGRHPSVARYIRSFPQSIEFIDRISELLIYLIPHYIREGKSYLTIAFGCTGGHHRSVMIASEIRKRLAKAGFKVKETHRDVAR
ncbi:MAG TPA: RNase adapter RapZ [Bryobacteraceae bacterium]|nr:RNase adapter RapZ [Bryobacteraceae bacterium]